MNLHNRVRKLEEHVAEATPEAIRLVPICDDGKGNLTKHGKPYTPKPGTIILRPRARE